MALFLSDQLNPAFMISTIHPFLQLLAHLEKRQLLPRNLNLLTCFWVSTGVGIVFFNKKGTKTPDFNPFPLRQRLGYLIEKKSYDLFSFRSGSYQDKRLETTLYRYATDK